MSTANEKEVKKQAYHKKKFYVKKSKEAITSTSSKPINRFDLNIVRWGQDGWILDYFNEHIFRGLMRDFHKEGGEQFNASPAILFDFYIDGIKDNSLPTPLIDIDLKKAKKFTRRTLSEEQLHKTIKKVGDFLFEGGVVMPEIRNLNTGETIRRSLPQKRQAIFSYCQKQVEKARGKKTVKHYSYNLLLTFFGIYLILVASAFYNVEFLPKSLYRLNHGCNDFFRSISGFQFLGHKKFSYLEVRERMGLRPHTSAFVERQHVERNLNYLKNNKVIEDWEIVGGRKKYDRNESIMYDIIFSRKTCKRKQNFAIRKAREQAAHKEAKLLAKKREKKIFWPGRKKDEI